MGRVLRLDRVAGDGDLGHVRCHADAELDRDARREVAPFGRRREDAGPSANLLEDRGSDRGSRFGIGPRKGSVLGDVDHIGAVRA